MKVQRVYEGKVIRMGNKRDIQDYDIYPARICTYVKIEYEVNGRIYHKKVNKDKIEGKTSGAVRIWYLKGSPTYVRYKLN